MSENPWYDYVVQRPLVTPTVQYISNCVAWTRCQLNYTLYDIEYIHPTTFLPSQALGNCDAKTKTWIVADGQRMYNSTNWTSICVMEIQKELCTPKTNTTFLFAYSNDMDAAIVQQIIKDLDTIDEELSPQFTTIANIRFDVLQEETIEYHNNYKDWITAMGSKLPDPSLSFTSPETGSDVLKVFSKFINNTQVPICGSRIYILMKRSPNEQDITDLVAQMRKYRIYFFLVTSSISSGGSHPETIRRLTTQTNGWDYYYADSYFVPYAHVLPPFFYSDNLIYAANVNLSPNGSIALPKMTVPRHQAMFYLNYDNLMSEILFLNASVYDMQLDYEVSDGVIYAVQIRIYTSGSDGYWIPYDD
ncbi:hypothetical protein GCK72_012371 [Caenorhabditis remanei]|uniref:VWFA domain-containing protein n=1 Tax=Caenorhabditis remanei TaxID=31234 RepID=A0A6A5GKR7_CAERE|nr:hypothetical protein GCK72_012371 [Caenorhabditis remanei]KAF1755918.1 hypothetical protein GCK72_012371 [Caenorhabditis remanei]